MIKRIICCILATCMLAFMLSLPCAAEPTPPPDTSHAVSVLLYNMDSCSLVFSQKANQKVYPAATVKIMVALIAIEHFSKAEGGLDTLISVPAEVIRESEGLNMELKRNETLTARDLIAGTVIAGANDAAYTLALAIDGSISAFLARMNRQAKAYGMQDTTYHNVSGLDYAPDTTANDLLILAQIAFENETYMQLAGTARYSIAATEKHAARTLYTRNYLLSKQTYADYYYAPATGMNAGATDAAGYCIVASACIDNQNYLCIVMGAEQFESFTLAKQLFTWVSSSYGYRRVLSKANVLGEISVSVGASSDYVTVIPKEEITCFLPTELDLEKAVQIDTEMYFKTLTAPVKQGLIVGKATVSVDGKEVGCVDLVTSSALSEDHSVRLGHRIHNFISSAGFIWTVVIIVLICVAYVLIVARIRYLRMVKQIMEVPEDEDDPPPSTPQLQARSKPKERH